jgi:hypothetical protein
MDNKNEIVIYSPDTSVNINVLLEDDTVRLSQAEMTDLFQTSRNNITMHI